MKKINVILFAALMVLFTSCGEKEKDDVENVGSGSITAKIGSTQVEFEHVKGAKALGILTIGGDKGAMRISMLLNADIQEGTYSGDDLPAMTFTADNGSTGLISMSGALTITKHNTSTNKIEGTFDVEFSNFGYTGSPVTAKGSFKVEYVDVTDFKN